MAAVAKIHISPPHCHHRTGQPPPFRSDFRRNVATWDPIAVKGRRGFSLQLQKCKSFRSAEEGEVDNDRKGMEIVRNLKEGNQLPKRRVYKLLDSIKSAALSVSSLRSDDKFMENLEESLSSIALRIGRYIVTMMSTGVILTVFQLSGGDSQLNDMIWYSWLGGIIIGTMIGSSMVLGEVSRAGPRNVVITGRMSATDEPRDVHVLWEEMIATPELIVAVEPEIESEPETDPEEDPEHEEEEPLKDLEGAASDAVQSEEGPEDSETEPAIEHALSELGALLQDLLAKNFKLGDKIQELEAKVQEFQAEKQELHAYWEDEITDRVKANEQVDELEEVRNKKARIDRMSYAFRKAFGQLQHRVYYYPAEEEQTRHTMSRGRVLDMADEQYADAVRRGLLG